MGLLGTWRTGMAEIAGRRADPGRAGRPGRIRPMLPWLLGVAIIAGVALLSGRLAERQQIAEAARRGEVELDRYAESLTLEFARFDVLPELCDLQDSIRQSLLQPRDAARVGAANRTLEQVARVAGATALYVMDLHGTVVASSNWDEPVSFVGIDLSYRPYFRDALRLGHARFYGIGTTSGTPGYYYARPLRDGGVSIGVAVVKIDLDTLQNGWGLRATDVILVDQNGVVMLASRPGWRYRTLAALPTATIAELRRTRQYEHASLEPLRLTRVGSAGGGASLVTMGSDAPGGDSTRLLAQEHPIGAAGWKVVVLSDITGAAVVAWAARAMAALSGATVALLLLYGGQRRRAAELEGRAKTDLAAAYGVLEQLVETRTEDLLRVNARLRETRDELVHAARLAALGQLAVGITHEMNQPLAAMLTLADNARTLLARDQAGEAGTNLSMISDLIRRMARMNGQLKLFARKTSPSFEPISVERCVANSLLILSDKIARTGAQVRRPAAAGSMVLADAARLEQVLVNLVGNALDAVAGRADPRVRIVIDCGEAQVQITVADNGGGVSPEAMHRLFEPFFTTKAAGEGLGLGLTISEGIVRDFGGTLQAANGALGAVFTVRLPRVMAAQDITQDAHV